MPVGVTQLESEWLSAFSHCEGCLHFLSGGPWKKDFYNSGRIKPFLHILACAEEMSYKFMINVIKTIMLRASKKGEAIGFFS